VRGSSAKFSAPLHTRIASTPANPLGSTGIETELKLSASVTRHPSFAASTHLNKIRIHHPFPISRTLDRIPSEYIPLPIISFSPSPPWGRGGRWVRGSAAKFSATLHTRIAWTPANPLGSTGIETELILSTSVTRHPSFAAPTHLIKIRIHHPFPISRTLDRIPSEYIPLQIISFSPSPPWGRGGRGVRGAAAKFSATLYTRIASTPANPLASTCIETELKLSTSVTRHPSLAASTHLNKIPIYHPLPIKRLNPLPQRHNVAKAMTSRLKPGPSLATPIYQPQPHPTGHGPQSPFSA
jgi:hypothetical protein